MTAIITSSTLESNAYSNIYDIMNNRSNIADPKGSSSESRPFILDSDPLMKSLSFAGTPYIILELPTLEYSHMSRDGKIKYLTWTNRITVRTARDGSGGGNTDTGRTDMLNICDDLQSTFNNSGIRNQLSELNIRMVNLTKTDTSTIELDQKYLYESSYELTYEIMLQVSD